MLVLKKEISNPKFKFSDGTQSRFDNLNCIPYLRLRTAQGFDVKLFIDTGANKNYLSPRLVNRAEQLPFPATITNIMGKHVIKSYVNFNPFPDIIQTTFIFHVFDFHKFFDGLIGYETLQQLGALPNRITTIEKGT